MVDKKEDCITEQEWVSDEKIFAAAYKRVTGQNIIPETLLGVNDSKNIGGDK